MRGIERKLRLAGSDEAMSREIGFRERSCAVGATTPDPLRIISFLFSLFWRIPHPAGTPCRFRIPCQTFVYKGAAIFIPQKMGNLQTPLTYGLTSLLPILIPKFWRGGNAVILSFCNSVPTRPHPDFEQNDKANRIRPAVPKEHTSDVPLCARGVLRVRPSSSRRGRRGAEPRQLSNC